MTQVFSQVHFINTAGRKIQDVQNYTCILCKINVQQLLFNSGYIYLYGMI